MGGAGAGQRDDDRCGLGAVARKCRRPHTIGQMSSNYSDEPSTVPQPTLPSELEPDDDEAPSRKGPSPLLVGLGVAAALVALLLLFQGR